MGWRGLEAPVVDADRTDASHFGQVWVVPVRRFPVHPQDAHMTGWRASVVMAGILSSLAFHPTSARPEGDRKEN